VLVTEALGQGTSAVLVSVASCAAVSVRERTTMDVACGLRGNEGRGGVSRGGRRGGVTGVGGQRGHWVCRCEVAQWKENGQV
jgi:hypothetical protein